MSRYTINFSKEFSTIVAALVIGMFNQEYISTNHVELFQVKFSETASLVSVILIDIIFVIYLAQEVLLKKLDFFAKKKDKSKVDNE